MAIILPIALLVWIALHSVTLVMSPSIDALMVREAPGPIKKGDLVSFKLVHPLAGPDPVDVTKRVMCMPGEPLRQIDLLTDTAGRYGRSAYLCAGRLVGITRPFGRKGQRLTPFPWGVRLIPDDFVYVGSDHPDGFDSRYYGPVRIERLRRMERVL
jgi:type IV secretory pathway protease TraF